jgi:hypothetical protein
MERVKKEVVIAVCCWMRGGENTLIKTTFNFWASLKRYSDEKIKG